MFFTRVGEAFQVLVSVKVFDCTRDTLFVLPAPASPGVQVVFCQRQDTPEFPVSYCVDCSALCLNKTVIQLFPSSSFFSFLYFFLVCLDINCIHR